MGATRTVRRYASFFFLLLAFSVAYSQPQPGTNSLQSLRQELQGLSPKEKELVNTIADTRAALENRRPDLERKKDSAEAVAQGIFSAHNNKHEQGTAEFNHWNNEYLVAKQASQGFQNEIAGLENDYNSALYEKKIFTEGKQRKIKEYLALIRQKDLSCFTALPANPSIEQLLECGRVDFDGQKKGLGDIGENPVIGTVIVPNVDAGAVIDESNETSRKQKEQQIQKIINSSTGTYRSPPVVVPPPAVNSSNETEPTLSNRLKEVLKDMQQRFQRRKTTAVQAVRD